jgi:hypothetical protein
MLWLRSCTNHADAPNAVKSTRMIFGMRQATGPPAIATTPMVLLSMHRNQRPDRRGSARFQNIDVARAVFCDGGDLRHCAAGQLKAGHRRAAWIMEVEASSPTFAGSKALPYDARRLSLDHGAPSALRRIGPSALSCRRASRAFSGSLTHSDFANRRTICPMIS